MKSKAHQRYIMIDTFCNLCGKKRRVNKYYVNKYIHCQSCAAKIRPRRQTYPIGEMCSNWKGGRIKKAKGYIDVKISKDHQFYCMAKNNDGYVSEHRLIMAIHLQRNLLPGEIVHHKNGIKDDNRIENLELLTNSKHMKDHTLGYSEGFKKGLYEGKEKRIKLLESRIKELEKRLENIECQKQKPILFIEQNQEKEFLA